MKPRNRTLSIFTLSALDVLAVATGTFVLLLVLLMPYYRKSFDATAEIEQVRASVATLSAESETLDQAVAQHLAAAAEARAEADRLAQEAAALSREMAERRDATRSAKETAAALEKRMTELRADAERRVIEELDVVFVVDTTRSMGPVLDQLALSMRGIVRILERLVPSVRIGFVAYRDRDAGVVPLITMPLTSTQTHLARVLRFVRDLEISPRPSRTRQEDLHLGFAKAASLPFRASAKQSIIVIGDAAAHRHMQSRTLQQVGRFSRKNDQASVSALFVSTPSSMVVGNADRVFFKAIAKAGDGAFSDHSGRMIESVLLSVLVD